MQTQFKKMFATGFVLGITALSVGSHFEKTEHVLALNEMANRSPANAADPAQGFIAAPGANLVANPNPVPNPAMNSVTSAPIPNIASLIQAGNATGQGTSLLGLSQLSEKIQSQMNASTSGIPYWNGIGPLPGSDFNPTFRFDSSGCTTVQVTFYDVYISDVTMPTLWCGAISTNLQPAIGAGGPPNKPPVPATASAI